MNNFNENQNKYEPYEFTDEVSASVTYNGISGQSNESASLWKIKKILTTGNVVTVQYPDGDQGFKFKWSERASYTYN